VQELQWMAIETLDSSLFGLRSIREGVERLKSILNHKE